MADELLNNIALLIDADNVRPDGLDPVLTELARLGQVNIRRAYGNWAKDSLRKWGDITNRLGIRPIQQFDLTPGKNATDMAMTIDALDLLYLGKVDGFGIMSSDSDFTPLVMRLRQDGLTVYVFGDSKTPEALKAACSRFIRVEELIAASVQEDLAAGTPAEKPAEHRKVSDDVVKLLADAWKASARENGFARLSEMGKIVNNRSSFDVRDYGFRRLSDLLESCNDRFKVERREDGVWVKRLR
ncbi:MAG: NYN domain-containing protein [Alteraurantiacibacter sp.]|nr:NYN domain-containing protein [Alteraurantiacibacter sp.]